MRKMGKIFYGYEKKKPSQVDKVMDSARLNWTLALF